MMKVFCGVPVFGRLAAANVSACEAEAEVDPGVADFYAFFANVLVTARELDLFEVFTLRHLTSSTPNKMIPLCYAKIPPVSSSEGNIGEA
jgi:hypothetical protein